MSPRRFWVALVVLGVCVPTLVAPIQEWHHHAATPAGGEHGGTLAGHHDCSLCILAPAIVAELPVGVILADLGPALALVTEPPVVTHACGTPLACARAPPWSLLPVA